MSEAAHHWFAQRVEEEGARADLEDRCDDLASEPPRPVPKMDVCELTSPPVMLLIVLVYNSGPV